MENALENDNFDENQSQVTDNVGQDVNETSGENSSTDWEQQAKYHQSEKDKLYAENQKFKQYEQLGKLLESRPDIVNTISTMAGGQPTTNAPERISLDKDEFDSWEAFNDPSSKSYKFRQQELQDKIDDTVNQRMVGVQKEVGMNKLQNELVKRGLNDEQINSFMEFASKNPADYGIDGAINMWQSVTQESDRSNQNTNPLDAIRQNQSTPKQAGLLNGQRPVQKSDEQSAWDAILKADRGSKLP